MTSRNYTKVLYGATRVGALAAIAACADRASMTSPDLSPERGPSFATAPAGEPIANLGGTTSYPLYAGGGGGSTGTLVGYLDVTSSGSATSRTFNVTYRAIGNYCFSETHLAITGGEASQFEGKNGNPAPGQFPYSKGGGCQQTVTYTGLGPFTLTGDSYVIAAHSVVSGAGSAGVPATNYVSGSSLPTTVVARRSGNSTTITSPNTPVVAAWEPPDGSEPSLWDKAINETANGSWLLANGADWVWESERSLDPVYGTVIQMQAVVNSPVAQSGTFRITCDNGYRLALNGTTLSTGDATETTYGTQLLSPFHTAIATNLGAGFPLNRTNVNGDGWQTVESYNVNLMAGANTFTIYAVNEYENSDDSHIGFPSGAGARPADVDIPGTIVNNPAGCIYGLQTAGTPSTPGIGSETAWGANASFGGSYTEPGNFSGKNWATFIYYKTK